MSQRLSLQLRGWALGENPGAIVHDLFGPTFIDDINDREIGRWCNEDMLPPDHPVGPIRSFVTVEADEPSWIEFIPGSQGQEAPPPGVTQPAAMRAELGKGLGLVLDARCWYRLLGPHCYKIRRWRVRPNESRP